MSHVEDLLGDIQGVTFQIQFSFANLQKRRKEKIERKSPIKLIYIISLKNQKIFLSNRCFLFPIESRKRETPCTQRAVSRWPGWPGDFSWLTYNRIKLPRKKRIKSGKRDVIYNAQRDIRTLLPVVLLPLYEARTSPSRGSWVMASGIPRWIKCAYSAS